MLAYFVFISAIYLFICRSPSDILGLKKRLLFYKYIGEVGTPQRKETIFQKGIFRFRRVVRLCIQLLRSFKAKKSNLTLEVFSFREYRLYLACICFWVYTVYLTYFRMISNGHINKTYDTYMDKYYCLYGFRSASSVTESLACFSRSTYFWSKFLMLALVTWLYLIIVQLKYGLPIWSSVLG